MAKMYVNIDISYLDDIRFCLVFSQKKFLIAPRLSRALNIRLRICQTVRNESR